MLIRYIILLPGTVEKLWSILLIWREYHRLHLIDVGISLGFLHSNLEDDIFIFWMDDETYHS